MTSKILGKGKFFTNLDLGFVTKNVKRPRKISIGLSNNCPRNALEKQEKKGVKCIIVLNPKFLKIVLYKKYSNIL